MEDAVAKYRAASEAGDIEAMVETLTPEVELVSPISGRMVFKGLDDVRIVLAAVYGSLRDLRWTDALGDGERRVIVAETRVGPVKMTDAMVLDLAPDGRIRRMAPHLRPWLALTLLGAILGPKVGIHPGVIRRALAGN